MSQPQAPKDLELVDRGLVKLREWLDRARKPGYNGDVTLRLDVADGKVRSFKVGQEETERQ